MNFLKIRSLAVVTLLSVFFVACAQQAEHVNLEDRLVPVEDEASLASVDEESDTVVSPTETSGELIGLREKVLLTSDISEKALDNVFAYFNKNQSVIRNKKYITVFDISKHSGQRRLYLIELATGKVTSMHVAHGSGSDTDNDGVATQFSNINGSHQSSLGYMLTAETYIGKNGESMRLDGQESRNNKVRARAVVVHGANYVSSSLSKMGRSQGCPAVSHSNIADLMAKTKNGSLFYIYHSAHDG